MDEMVISAVLKVWTNANKLVTDVSLASTVISESGTPTLTLTFTHGSTLASGDDVALYLWFYDDSEGAVAYTVFTAVSSTNQHSCTATTTTPQGDTGDLPITSALATDGDPDLLT